MGRAEALHPHRVPAAVRFRGCAVTFVGGHPRRHFGLLGPSYLSSRPSRNRRVGLCVSQYLHQEKSDNLRKERAQTAEGFAIRIPQLSLTPERSSCAICARESDNCR